MGEAVVGFGRKAHPIQKRCHPFLFFTPLADAVNRERLANDLSDAHARVQRGIRVLENELNLLPDLFSLF